MGVGVLEAKNRLSALIAEVGRGAEVTITSRGKPVAKLVPIEDEAARRERANAAFDRILARRKALYDQGLRVTHEEIKEWIEEGRR